MGNDGGSIPKRRELVKEAARNPTTQQIKESRNEQQDFLWNVDLLSQKPLATPVVSDALGRLFNKDSVIEYLLPSQSDDENSKKADQEVLLQGAIKSLKDIVEIKFTIEQFEESQKVGGIRRGEKWVCPVTGLELGPGANAVYLVPCGHAFSGSAIKEISGETCLQCNEPYASNDIIPIFPSVNTDIARLSLRTKTLKEKGLTHALKKSAGGGKKRKKHAESADTVQPPPNPIKAQADDVEVVSKLSIPLPLPKAMDSSNAIKNASTAFLTQKVLEEQEQRNKRRRMDKNDNLKSLFSKSTNPAKVKPTDISFMNRGFSIPSRR